jgi:hypothetical protein
MEPKDLLPPPGAEPPAGPDELRSIVRRADRRRLRLIAGGIAAALAAGAGVGYAVSQVSSPSGQTVVAGSSGPQSPAINASNSGNGASSPSGSSGGSSAGGGASISGEGGSLGAVPGPVGLPAFTRVFTRQVGNVDVRGFTVSYHVGLPSAEAPCPVYAGFTRFQVEVSTPNMVGTAVAMPVEATPSASTAKLSTVYGQVMGVSEGDPVDVVTAYVGAGVSKVKMNFAATGTSDTMAPVKGWVALAAELPTSAKQNYENLGSLQALNAAGGVVDTITVRDGFSGTYPQYVPGCLCPGPAMRSSSPGSGPLPGSTVYACPVMPKTSPPAASPSGSLPNGAATGSTGQGSVRPSVVSPPASGAAAG